MGFKAIDSIIEGEATGADKLAREIGEEAGVYVDKVPADWEEYGNAAGPIRNRWMLAREPDCVVGFHDDLEHSKGTKDCLTEALRQGIPTYIWTHKVGLKQMIHGRTCPPVVIQVWGQD